MDRLVIVYLCLIEKLKLLWEFGKFYFVLKFSLESLEVCLREIKMAPNIYTLMDHPEESA